MWKGASSDKSAFYFVWNTDARRGGEASKILESPVHKILNSCWFASGRCVFIALNLANVEFDQNLISYQFFDSGSSRIT